MPSASPSPSLMPRSLIRKTECLCQLDGLEEKEDSEIYISFPERLNICNFISISPFSVNNPLTPLCLSQLGFFSLIWVSSSYIKNTDFCQYSSQVVCPSLSPAYFVIFIHGWVKLLMHFSFIFKIRKPFPILWPQFNVFCFFFCFSWTFHSILQSLFLFCNVKLRFLSFLPYV